MIVATRVLTLRNPDGDTDVPVRIFAPEPDDRCWKVRYAIEWPDKTYESAGFGEDAVQALLLTFQKIGIELYVSDEHKSGRLGWNEPGQGYGFPLAKTVRDLAVGYDKELG